MRTAPISHPAVIPVVSINQVPMQHPLGIHDYTPQVCQNSATAPLVMSGVHSTLPAANPNILHTPLSAIQTPWNTTQIPTNTSIAVSTTKSSVSRVSPAAPAAVNTCIPGQISHSAPYLQREIDRLQGQLQSLQDEFDELKISLRPLRGSIFQKRDC